MTDSLEKPVLENESVASPPTKGQFDIDLIKKYPKSNKKIALEVLPYGLEADSKGQIKQEKWQTTHISPHGLEFQGLKEYPAGTLLKIHIKIPNYWNRKQQFVDYQRIDSPENFKILAKVLKSQDVGKRGKKKIITAQTVNIDEIDESVLKTFLQE